jgi:hypothetical protein
MKWNEILTISSRKKCKHSIKTVTTVSLILILSHCLFLSLTWNQNIIIIIFIIMFFEI